MATVRASLGDFAVTVQHVIDLLHGYLALAQRLHEAGPAFGGGWNFGPDHDGSKPVSWVIDRCVQCWGGTASWELDNEAYPAEAQLLHLDCAKARTLLGWRPRLPLEHAVGMTIEWYREVIRGADAMNLCLRQIDEFSGRGPG